MNRKLTSPKSSHWVPAAILIATLSAVLLPACSIRRTAVNVIGNALLVLLAVVLLITYVPAITLGAGGIICPAGVRVP